MTRRGVLGGTFDPPHRGHLAAATAARDALALDQVLWVPAGRPPHKPHRVVSAAEHRWRMARLAVEDGGGAASGFQASRLELDRDGPSYTVDTLHLLATQHPEVDWVFIVGADVLPDLPGWHEARRLFDYAAVALVSRPGYALDLRPLNVLGRTAASRIYHVPTVEVAVSATAIRSRVAAGGDVSEWVTPRVADYIWSHGLYRERADGDA